jgi:cysteine synthase
MDLQEFYKTIPRTQPIRLDWFGPEGTTVWLKTEWTDPDGPDPLRSLKRKPAYYIFHDAVQKQYATPDKLLLVASSGNLGVELALLANQHRLPLYCVAPGEIIDEGLDVLKATGAHVLTTSDNEVCPREFTVFFARGYAHEFHHRLVNLEQFYSWLNPLVHSVTTAPEIFDGDFGKVDAVCCCVGSCGTLGGILTYLATTGYQAQVWSAQPEVSQQVPGTHVIRGSCRWAPENFSPVVFPEERVCTVEFVDSMAYTVKLWEQGIPAGPSSGMALALAAEKIRDGLRGNIVVLSADNNFKYPQLLFDEFTKHRGAILERHSDLEQPLQKYLDELRQAIEAGGLDARIARAYSVPAPGTIRDALEIEDIVAESQRKLAYPASKNGLV